MAQQEAWRTYLQLALGVTEASRKRATKAARDLLGRGGVTAEQLQALAEDIVKTGMANREALTTLIRYELDRTLGRVGLATAEQVDELTTRVRDLERQLGEARGTHGTLPATATTVPTAGPATPPTAVAKKATRKVAKKAVKTAAPAGAAAATPEVARTAKASVAKAPAGRTGKAAAAKASKASAAKASKAGAAKASKASAAKASKASAAKASNASAAKASKAGKATGGTAAPSAGRAKAAKAARGARETAAGVPDPADPTSGGSA